MAGVKKRAGRNIAEVVRTINKDLSYTNKRAFWDVYFGTRESGVSMASRDLILRKIRERLYRYGIDGKQRKLAPYSSKTINIKKGAKPRQPTTRTTLRFTGAWYKSMYVYNEVDGGSKKVAIEVRTKDGPSSDKKGGRTIHEKTKYLKNKYSGEILTITKDEEKLLVEDMERYFFEMFDYDFSQLKIEIR
jgi:hypothetical protein